jgi:hypothetical protein
MSFGSDVVQGTVTTNNATPTTAVSYDFVANGIPDNSSAIVVLKVLGFDASQNTVGIEQRYIVKRATGNCSIVGLGSTVIAAEDLALATASAVLVANGTAIEIHVTGVLLTTIGWGARIELFYLN